MLLLAVELEVVNTYLMSTEHSDKSVTLIDFQEGEIAFEGHCANAYVARAVTAILDTNYSDARRTMFIMNKFYKEGGKYEDDY